MTSVVATAARDAQAAERNDKDDEKEEEEKVEEILLGVTKDDEAPAEAQQTVTLAAAMQVESLATTEFPASLGLSLPPLSAEGNEDGVARAAASDNREEESGLLLPDVSPAAVARHIQIHSERFDKEHVATKGPRRKRPSAKSFLLQERPRSTPMIQLQGRPLNVSLEMDDEDFPTAYAFHLSDLQSEKEALEKQDESDMIAVGRNNKAIRQQIATGMDHNQLQQHKKAVQKRKAAAAAVAARRAKKQKVDANFQSVLEQVMATSPLPSPPVAAIAAELPKQSASLDGVAASPMKKPPAKSPAKRKAPPKSSTSSSSTPTTTGARAKAKEVWSGIPDEHLPGHTTWPPGWTKKVFERASGGTKGHTDRYWYSPVNQYKFRSMVEIGRFFSALEKTNNDEEQAWKIMKGR